MTKDYDPLKVVLTIGGVAIEGYADGTFITVARNNQMWTLQSGASGETARSKSNDRSGTVEIVLMQTSMSNDLLSGKVKADELTNGGKFLLGIDDEHGKTLVAGLESWVQQQPSTEFAKELSERTWIIETGDLEMFIGGTE
jgi:hypothetical protein